MPKRLHLFVSVGLVVGVFEHVTHVLTLFANDRPSVDEISAFVGFVMVVAYASV